jgi:DNA-binding response OmpR family regulator
MRNWQIPLNVTLGKLAMQHKCRLTYVGQDRAAIEELASRFDYGDFVVETIDPIERGIDGGGEEVDGPLNLWPASDWYRVVLLDIDVLASSGMKLFARLRAENAGIPVILVAKRDSTRLTQQSLSGMHGADALVFKPLSTAPTLEDVVSDAFRRLDRWQETLSILEERQKSCATR